MMQALGIAILSLSILLALVSAIVLASTVFIFRPFDHQKVAYRAGSLFTLSMPLMMLGMSLYEGHLSPLRLRAIGELLLLMVVSALAGLLFRWWLRRDLRSWSEIYAEREATLAERKRQREGARGDGERASS